MNRKNFVKQFNGFIQRAVKLNELARRHGLTSLECEVEDLDDEDFKQGLRFIIDEVPAGVIDEIYSNKITFAKGDYERRYKTIVKRTVLAIQAGLSTRLLVFVLFSYAGLTRDEQREIEYIVMRDPPGPDDSETEKEDPAATVATYQFNSLRHWAMAVHTIATEIGEEPAGVNFGYPTSREITITDNCEDPDKVTQIITANDGTLYVQEDLELDIN